MVPESTRRANSHVDTVNYGSASATKSLYALVPATSPLGLEKPTESARDGRRSLRGVAAHRLATAAGQGEAMDAVAPRARAMALSMRPAIAERGWRAIRLRRRRGHEGHPEVFG
jgi:hypothetical protein